VREKQDLYYRSSHEACSSECYLEHKHENNSIRGNTRSLKPIMHNIQKF
jgi:hypothetical protein